MGISPKEFKVWLLEEAKKRVENSLKKTTNRLSQIMMGWPLAYKQDIIKSIPTIRRLKNLLVVSEEKEDYETCQLVVDELKKRESKTNMRNK